MIEYFTIQVALNDLERGSIGLHLSLQRSVFASRPSQSYDDDAVRNDGPLRFSHPQTP